jgi:hypothetical protein
MNGGIFFKFMDGNAHLYGDAVSEITETPPVFTGTGGGNAEGDAILFVVGGSTTASGFLHAWFGFNSVGVGSPQQVQAQTIAFTGTITSAGPYNGESISINANAGGTTSASGHQNGWGQLTMVCS